MRPASLTRRLPVSQEVRFGMVVLRELLEAVQPLRRNGDDATPIGGVAYDSRQVRPGDLFVAIRGLRQDGHQFVAEAVRRGAAAVLVEDAAYAPGVPYGVVSDGRRALGLAAAAFYGFPARKLRMVGVTGTDGKTTTTHLTASILEAAGYRVGVISTVAVQVAGVTLQNNTAYTTPQAPELQALLAKMVAAGADYAVVEVSSHALSLERVAGCDFDVAIFTNLTSEHLDFHGSLEEYRRQKARLFEMLGHGRDKGAAKAGVVNADDPSFAFMVDACPAPVVSYGLECPANVSARSLRLAPDGARFVVGGPFGELELRTPLAGQFNVYNWLAAIGAAFTQGATPPDFLAAATATEPVPGRLQRVDLGQPFTVIVDFAHTPNALAKALEALRPMTAGRLIVLFGHAGGRDAHNRPRMGEVAGRKADLTVLTTDDPYDEPPEAIIEGIAPGLEQVGRQFGVDYFKVTDRRQAIALALSLAVPGDTVVLAGRGHEQYTTVQGQRIRFDDVEEVSALLRDRIKGRPSA